MKLNLLKTMLVAVGMAAGLNASAETKVVKSWDFTKFTEAPTLGTESIKINSMVCLYGTGSYEGLAIQSATWYANSTGLTQGNGDRNIGVLDLKQGDVVTIHTSASSLSAFVNGTENESSTGSTDGTYIITASTDGFVGFKFARNYYMTSITVTRDIIEGQVEKPTGRITAVNGVNRTVTFTTETEGATLYKSDDEDGTYESFDGTVTVSQSQTIYVKASLNGVDSDILAYEVAAGVEVKLNTPVYSKTAWNNGVSTIQLTSNQTDVLLAPTAKIAYSLSLSSTNGVVNNGETIEVADGETLTIYSVADGYANSDNIVAQAVAPFEGITAWEETYKSATDKVQITWGADAVGEISSTPYYYMYANDNQISEHLTTANENSTNFIYRPTGIYSGNRRVYAIFDMKKGQNVTFNGVKGNDVFVISAATNLTADTWNTINNASYVYTVNEDGPVSITIERYSSLASVVVKDAAKNVTISAAGLATYAPSVALDFTNAEKIAAYKATVKDNTVTLTKVETVAAGEGVLLRSLDGGEVTEAIAVAASATEKNTGNDFVAVTEATTLNETEGEYTNYVLSQENGVVGFFKANSTKIAAGKAYLKVATSSAAKGIKVVFDGEATGISEVSAAKADEAYYTVSGLRVEKPTKGLYIRGGKKVVVK